MPSQHPDETGPAGERPMQGRPAVPPSRPRATPPARPQEPVHHATEQIDLRAGFPPVRHETTEIDLSQGLPAGLPLPPRRTRQGRRLGVDVGTVRVGVALSDPTGTLALAEEQRLIGGDTLLSEGYPARPATPALADRLVGAVGLGRSRRARP